MIRVDFQGNVDTGTAQEVSWNEWFQQFEITGRAPHTHDETATSEDRYFTQLVSGEELRSTLDPEHRMAAGDAEDETDADLDEDDLDDEDDEDEDLDDEDDEDDLDDLEEDGEEDEDEASTAPR